MTSSRWQCSHSQLQSPLQKDQLTSVTDKTPLWNCKTLGVRLGTVNRDWGRLYWKGKRSSYTLTEWPLHQASPAPRADGPPGPTVSSVAKREPKVGIQLPQCCGMLQGGLLRSLLMRINGGNLWSWSPGDQIKMEQRAELTVTRSSQTTVHLTSALKQRYQAADLPICRANPVSSSGKGAWLATLPNLDPQPKHHTAIKLML